MLKVTFATKKRIRSISIYRISFTEASGEEFESIPTLEEIKEEMIQTLKEDHGLEVIEVHDRIQAQIIMRTYRRVYYQEGAEKYYNVYGADLYTKSRGKWLTSVLGKENPLAEKVKKKSYKEGMIEAHAELQDYYFKKV